MEKEKETAQKRADGSKAVVVKPTPYRPKLESTYVEPELNTEDDGLKFLYEQHGKAIIQPKMELPPRMDVILFNPKLHQDQFDKSIQWGDCPEDLQPKVEEIIKNYWDVFAKEGLKQPIRGF